MKSPFSFVGFRSWNKISGLPDRMVCRLVQGRKTCQQKSYTHDQSSKSKKYKEKREGKLKMTIMNIIRL